MVAGRSRDISFSGVVTGLIGKGKIKKDRNGQDMVMGDEDEQSTVQKIPYWTNCYI